MIYSLVYSLILLLFVIEYLTNFRKYNFLYSQIFFLVFVGLLLFVGFRYEIGPDWDSYHEMFSFLTFDNFLAYAFEYGFSFLIVSTKFVNNSFSFFIFIVAFLALLLKFLFIKKYSPYIFLSILIYLAIQLIDRDFGQIRQGLALGITIWGYHFAIQKKPIHFLVIAILAFSVHYTAIIFFFAYPLCQIRISLLQTILLLVGAIIIGFFFTKFIAMILHSFSGHRLIANKIEVYLASKDFGFKLGLLIGHMLKIGILILFHYLRKKHEDLNPLFNLYLAGLLILFIFNSIAIFAGRFALYFFTYEIIILPYMIKYTDNRWLRSLLTVYVLAYVTRIYFPSIYEYEMYFFPYNNYIIELYNKLL